MGRERRIPLLPGLPWHGYLKIIAWDGENPVVQFTAQNKSGLWIYDHAPLTPKQFRDWTGIEAKEMANAE